MVSSQRSDPGGVIINRYTKIRAYRDWIDCTIGKPLCSLTRRVTDTSDTVEHHICVKSAD